MIPVMSGRIAALFACLVLSASAAAETIYKYRHPDGSMVYSNKPQPGLELIESLDYSTAAPASGAGASAASQGDAGGEARITKQIEALQAAWTEVQEASRALGVAEERLRAGQDPGAGAGVRSARERLDAALRKYNELR